MKRVLEQLAALVVVATIVGVGPVRVEGLHAAFIASPHHYENLVEPTPAPKLAVALALAFVIVRRRRQADTYRVRL